MAIPLPVKLRCPLCETSFQARSTGRGYFISGVDTDLRETGSIEDVRRFAVATCPTCRYTDLTWDLEGGEDLPEPLRARIRNALDARDAPRPKGRRGRLSDFDRFELAERCFGARGLDASSRAELALLAYYVARDLGRRDLEPRLRDAAADLFEEALAGEDLPAALELRYAYVAGELRRRAGDRGRAVAHFERAIRAGEPAGDDGTDEAPRPHDLLALARRQLAVAVHEDDAPSKLEKLARAHDPDESLAAARLLARRRGKSAVEAIRRVFKVAGSTTRLAVLRELAQEPAPELADLALSVIESSPSPEEVRLAARVLGAVGEPSFLDALVRALERGVLATEAALCEAIRRIDAPAKTRALRRVLDRWEALRSGAAEEPDEAWRFTPDLGAVKALLYATGDPWGLSLLARDLQALRENDLWDKPPSGSPVTAALALASDPRTGRAALGAIRGLLSDQNPATRRWATWVISELEAKDALEDVRPLVHDRDRVVRLEAARAVARLGDGRAAAACADVVLGELEQLDEADVPFALHFLVPFRGERVKTFLVLAIERRIATPGEVYPLLGRQDPDARTRRLLEAGLEDPSDEVRGGAVTGYAFLASSGDGNGKAAAMQLRALYDEEDVDDVRRRIVFGLARLAEQGIERDETLAFLRARLESSDRRVRFPIALALLQLGDAAGIDVVRERAALLDESADHYDLVAPALRALARANGGAGLAVRARAAAAKPRAKKAAAKPRKARPSARTRSRR